MQRIQSLRGGSSKIFAHILCAESSTFPLQSCPPFLQLLGSHVVLGSTKSCSCLRDLPDLAYPRPVRLICSADAVGHPPCAGHCGWPRTCRERGRPGSCDVDVMSFQTPVMGTACSVLSRCPLIPLVLGAAVVQEEYRTCSLPYRQREGLISRK